MRIDIIDDDLKDLELLKGFLCRYKEEKKVPLTIVSHNKDFSFIEKYHGESDVIFLDVEMPEINGFSAAKKIRKCDPYVKIIFVTNFAQYATKGYEVNAFDYLVKPVSYPLISAKLDRLLSLLNSRNKIFLLFETDHGTIKIMADDIYYAESSGHYSIFYSSYGVFKKRMKLDEIAKVLPSKTWSRCGVSFLVNLRYVSRVHGSLVKVLATDIPISRNYRSCFLQDLTFYMGEGL